MRRPVSFSCGHAYVTSVLGLTEEARAKRIAYLAASKCSLCWRAKQEPSFTLANNGTGGRFYVQNGYAIREDLKARAYRFGTVSKSWSKTLASAGELEAERLWIVAAGYALRELEGKS